MEFALIREGDRIQLKQKKTGIASKTIYESYVTKLYSDQRVFEMETPRKSLSWGIKGELYELVFYTSSGNVVCDASIIKTYRTEDVKTLTMMRIVSLVTFAQLRNHPRYKVSLPFRYSLMKGNEELTDDPEKVYEGVLADLGVGGIKFYSPVSVNSNTRIRGIIEKSDGALLTEARVLSSRKLDENDIRYKYEIRAKFIKTTGSRRKKMRIKCSLPIRYTVLQAPANQISTGFPTGAVFHGIVKNISENGIRLSGSSTLELGTLLYMEIENESIMIRAEGEVVSKIPILVDGVVKTYDNGVKFVNTIRN